MPPTTNGVPRPLGARGDAVQLISPSAVQVPSLHSAEPATVMRIPRNLFRKTLEGFPDAAERMRDHMAARARNIAEEISQVRGSLNQAPSQRTK